MPTQDQPSLLARIRALSERIYEYRYRFALPKGHKDRYETHGAASGLQRLQQERQQLQGALDPIKLIATGISCRDCIHFADVDEPLCRHGLRNLPTKVKRSNTESCGPEARLFEPIVAHA